MTASPPAPEEEVRLQAEVGNAAARTLLVREVLHLRSDNACLVAKLAEMTRFRDMNNAELGRMNLKFSEQFERTSALAQRVERLEAALQRIRARARREAADWPAFDTIAGWADDALAASDANPEVQPKESKL